MQIETVIAIAIIVATIFLLALFCWVALRIVVGKSRSEGKRFGLSIVVGIIIVILLIVIPLALHLPFELTRSFVQPPALRIYVLDPLIGLDYFVLLLVLFFVIKGIFDNCDHKEAFYVSFLIVAFIIIYTNVVNFILGTVLGGVTIPFVNLIFPPIA